MKNSSEKASSAQTTTSANQQQLELPSSVEALHIIEKLIETICSTYTVNEDHYGNILVGVTEAVNNAIYHGNRSDPNKKIHVGFETTPQTIVFSIRDEGPGFDFNNLPDPTDPENLEKPSGRGIFLMKALADEVSFTDDGRCVTISYNMSK
ncbi:MAG TPA: ATP-binding protein [Bacteroidia bacterium]|jgi:serine/threonine-protein kinase RsbW|nr:ATP-binding protein [Bacteroidia bacterium]